MNKKEICMENELWLKKIHERLDDYSEPLPADGWERLEKELPAIPKGHRTIVLRRWAVAVAAMLTGILSFIGLRMLDRETQSISPTIPLARIQQEADRLPVPARPSQATKRFQNTKTTLATYSVEKPQLPNNLIVSTEPMKDERPEQEATIEKQPRPAKQPQKQKSTVLPDDNGGLLAMAEPTQRSSGWSMALSVSNNGAFKNSIDNSGMRPLAQSSPGTGFMNIDLTATSNSLITIPEGQKLIFKNGVPYLQNEHRKVLSADHKQPVSVGISVRKNLPKHFSLETGLVYTYLASELLYENASTHVNQRLHYLGIPLRANWNFIDKEYFLFYLSAGGMMEKCIYGKIGTETETVAPLQWSVMASLGAQYNLSKRIGIYVEPGISYYFNDGSDVVTIRKDNPCNFTLQAGLRLSY